MTPYCIGTVAAAQDHCMEDPELFYQSTPVEKEALDSPPKILRKTKRNNENATLKKFQKRGL